MQSKVRELLKDVAEKITEARKILKGEKQNE